MTISAALRGSYTWFCPVDAPNTCGNAALELGTGVVTGALEGAVIVIGWPELETGAGLGSL